MIRSTGWLLKKQTVPVAETGAMAALATLASGVKFTLDTNGCGPHGNTVTNPFAAASTAVTFNDTALTPTAGTRPVRSVSFTVKMLPLPTLPLAMLSNAPAL